MAAGLVALCAALIAAPAPAGLPEAGKRVIAVAVLAIGLWCTEALPAGVTSLVLIVALVLSGGVAGFPEALVGFSDPVAYFLIGVLTIGLAVSAAVWRSASRISSCADRRAAPLVVPATVARIPAADIHPAVGHDSTRASSCTLRTVRGAGAGAASRSARAGDHDGAQFHQPARLDRRADRRHHADGVGGPHRRHYWSQWLLLMSVPYLALLTIGSLLIYLLSPGI